MSASQGAEKPDTASEEYRSGAEQLYPTPKKAGRAKKAKKVERKSKTRRS
jgi:hypothetical protein